ncbi:DUF1501 domain-containing protein [Massilia dura]|uniref:DUF1501 domain-containing protein n=1 Tax=Pseudoduganella dura TaxID=321982 RepID=A0A6I3XPE7_9BURK|nr:DUF1501 domain-containing protein [Pseudoduganella dura]MUI14518.1 DUF1501 domain-containing protein [Pseudoduganella dura]GGY16893.1 hypothetical protein GCM10007386_53340 [Pseudoduganella dura]
MERRAFLYTLGAGLALTAGRQAWAVSSPQPTQRKLVVVMLRGAVDGLNVVAPVADAHYAQLRPTIALAPPGSEGGGALDLDGYFGLHPALAPLLPLWEAKKLAFVHASGSPDETRSHFDAQDYMESATPGVKSTPDGWLNRLVLALPGTSTPTRALGIGPVLPRILAGRAAAVNLPNGAAAVKPGVLESPALGAAFDRLYDGHERFGRVYQATREARREVIDAAASPLAAQMMAAGMDAGKGAPLPNGFPDDAARLATLLRNDPNVQLAFIALGGWDTHAGQGGATGQLANRLAPLGQGLAVLAERLGPMLDDTTIVVMSEFGRTARENGNGGTDHGRGNAMWVLGGRVNGGKVHGRWPGIGPDTLNENRDLAITTDFRTVLAQVAERHLRLPDRQLAAVFPKLPAGGNLDLLHG